MNKRIVLSLSILILSAAISSADEGDPSVPETVSQPVAVPAAVATPAAPAPVVSTPVAAAPAAQKVITETILRDDNSESVVGTVASITPSSLRQVKSKIAITDQSGNEVEFVVKALAVIYDAGGSLLALDELTAGQKVQVNYRLKTGNIKEATSIKVM